MESKKALKVAESLQWVTIALCLFFIANNSIGIMRIDQRMKLSQTNHDDSVPDNLVGDADIFALSMGARHPDFPYKEMTDSREWEEFQRHLLGYATRIKLMETQTDAIDKRLNEQTMCLLFAYMGMIALSAVFSKLGKVK